MGNTVGSLSEAQHSLVIGSLLGDGSMRCKTHALLEINHSASQRGYVDWKYQHLAELVATRSAVYLNTQQFDEDAQWRLVELLKGQWGIKASLNRDKSYYRIRIAVASMPRFIDLVEPHVLPEFRYKLPLVTP